MRERLACGGLLCVCLCVRFYISNETSQHRLPRPSLDRCLPVSLSSSCHWKSELTDGFSDFTCPGTLVQNSLRVEVWGGTSVAQRCVEAQMINFLGVSWAAPNNSFLKHLVLILCYKWFKINYPPTTSHWHPFDFKPMSDSFLNSFSHCNWKSFLPQWHFSTMLLHFVNILQFWLHFKK